MRIHHLSSDLVCFHLAGQSMRLRQTGLLVQLHKSVLPLTNLRLHPSFVGVRVCGCAVSHGSFVCHRACAHVQSCIHQRRSVLRREGRCTRMQYDTLGAGILYRSASCPVSRGVPALKKNGIETHEHRASNAESKPQHSIARIAASKQTKWPSDTEDDPFVYRQHVDGTNVMVHRKLSRRTGFSFISNNCVGGKCS